MMCNILYACHRDTEIALGEYELTGEHHSYPGTAVKTLQTVTNSNTKV